MARSRSGGGAYAMALVAMGCLFVVALLFAIIFYTKIEEAETAQADAEKNLARFITSSETAMADKLPVENGSIYNYQADRIDTLTGQVSALTAQIAEAELLASQANEQVNVRTNTINTLQAKVTELETKARADLQAHQAEVDRLSAANDALQQQLAQLKTQVQTQITGAGDAARQQVEALNEQLLAAQATEVELRNLILDLEREKERLGGLLGANVLETRVTTADGEISSIFANGDQMFINRGRNQGIMLGMTFEVYNPGIVISLEDGTNQLRGKATIEVFKVDAESSTCRIVRQTRNTVIDPGDPIANIVYDPEKTYTFFVFGYFDVEGDDGPNDIDRIRNMITQWKAKSASLKEDEEGLPILVPEVDYLVLGEEPEFPVDPGDIIDPVQIREYQEKRQAYETYQKLVEEAKRLRIPILNQNRFLDLTGYYQR